MPGKHQILCFAFCALLLMVSGCSSVPAETGTEDAAFKRWHYQLQNADPVQLAAGGYGVAVIDPTADGSEETRFTEEQLEQMKGNGTIVLAYFSIGEASSYLDYWNPDWGTERDGVLQIAEEAPEWLGWTPNPDWPESVKVRYWQEAWWDILEPELKKLKKQDLTVSIWISSMRITTGEMKPRMFRSHAWFQTRKVKGKLQNG